MDVMPDARKPKKQKPGPDPERLVITDDPASALDKLLKKPAKSSVKDG